MRGAPGFRHDPGDIDPSTGTTPPGRLPDATCQNFATLQCVIFSGEIVSDVDASLTDLQITAFTPGTSHLVLNPNFLFAFGPAFLTAGVPFSGPIFEIDVSPTASPGLYSANAILFTDDPDNPTVEAFFAVEVTPEPDTLALVSAAFLALALIRPRRRSC